ncbi:unnamed protein product [Tetraodon nigroviridis]|uniref:(spotted green pufferfish) hypothetical protein n=1 Tax=Tetraodon nigroviridis TaxID=99883 RepID=Q4RMZ2_TETNG|nr:unnamed protein product [Tetraodon nigroviridis]
MERLARGRRHGAQGNPPSTSARKAKARLWRGGEGGSRLCDDHWPPVTQRRRMTSRHLAEEIHQGQKNGRCETKTETGKNSAYLGITDAPTQRKLRSRRGSEPFSSQLMESPARAGGSPAPHVHGAAAASGPTGQHAGAPLFTTKRKRIFSADFQAEDKRFSFRWEPITAGSSQPRFLQTVLAMKQRRVVLLGWDEGQGRREDVFEAGEGPTGTRLTRA